MNPKLYYQSLAKEKINCPICDASDYQILCKNDRYSMGVQSCGCNCCGLIFINPRPLNSEMNKFYSSMYRKYYESIEVPTEDYVRSGPFEARASFVSEKIASVIDTNSNFRLLDIGCAEGTLLKRLGVDFLNAELHGLEPDPNFAEFARRTTRATVLTGDFQSLQTRSEFMKFDLVTLTHVLEHILDPNNFLQILKTALNENGYLYVEVPNISHHSASSIRAIHIGHVLSFSPPNLKKLLIQNGFKIVEEYYDGLPARTPSMAILVQNCNVKETFSVTKEQISTIFNHFTKNIAQPEKSNKGLFRRLISLIK